FIAFFFQAEDGIRAATVTGVQTCALPILRPAHIAAFADQIADRALRLLSGEAPAVRGGVRVSIVDDDVGGPYRVGPRDVFETTLKENGVGRGGWGVVLLYSEPRSWKGRADLGARSLAALRRPAPGAKLVVLFGPPRLARQVP